MDWEPIPPGGFRLPPYLPHTPTPRQALFLGLHHVREAMYGGAAGGGKSDAVLMDAMQYADVPRYSALILRRTFPDLNKPGAIMDRAKSWLLPAGIKWHEGQHTFTFPVAGLSDDTANVQGARLSFGYLNSEKDKYSYQSAEYQYIAFDEGTQFLETEYTYLFSRCRRPSELSADELLAKVPLRVRMATNPGNIGHEWVKSRFIPQPDPITGQIVFPRDSNGSVRGFVKALLSDNPYLDAEEYAKNLSELTPIERLRLLTGDWDARPAGEMFDSRRMGLCYYEDGSWWAYTDSGSRKLNVTKWVRYWDLASTKPHASNMDPDYTVGVLMGKTPGNEIVVADVVRLRDLPAVVESTVIDTAKADKDRWDCRTVRMEVEGGSSGQFTRDRFARVLIGFNFQGDHPTGPKEERARWYASAVGNSLVFLPSGAAWAPAYRSECDAFPTPRIHDDQVDASSGAFKYLAEAYQSGSATVSRDATRPGTGYASNRGSSPYAARRPGLMSPSS